MEIGFSTNGARTGYPHVKTNPLRPVLVSQNTDTNYHHILGQYVSALLEAKLPAYLLSTLCRLFMPNHCWVRSKLSEPMTTLSISGLLSVPLLLQFLPFFFFFIYINWFLEKLVPIFWFLISTQHCVHSRPQ